VQPVPVQQFPGQEPNVLVGIGTAGGRRQGVGAAAPGSNVFFSRQLSG
jgi:hypothetical protein